ncbi:tyrosine-type recombinase/integrase [Bauldia litoralis]|uniref:tyrosine-type recombinase/integrase n=1 Tax=Bauldia litoralis TaxID=665467 RepID=UPI0032647343
MAKKITSANYTKLMPDPGKNDQLFADAAQAGLAIRVRRLKDGNITRQWRVTYRIRGTDPTLPPTRENLGRVDAVDIDFARVKAKAIMSAAAKGDDPREIERVEAERKREIREATLGSFIPRYLEFKADLKPRSLADLKYQLETQWAPLHDTPISAITVKKVSDRMEEIQRDCRRGDSKTAGNAPAIAAKGAMRNMFRWLMSKGEVDSNPAAAALSPAKPPPRDRVLEDDELRDIWNRCGDNDAGRIARLLMLTGVRREEVGGMRWDEIDTDKARWTLERDRPKNSRHATESYKVILSDPALEILRSVKRIDGREHVFGTKIGKGYGGFSKFGERLEKKVNDARAKEGLEPLDHWTPHDFRRTVETRMGERPLSVPDRVIDKILNHKIQGVRKHYDFSELEPDIRDAMAAWGDYVMRAVSGEPPASNVVPIKRASESAVASA